MNRTTLFPNDRPAFRFLAMALALAAGLSASAQDVQHLSITQQGGMPGLPVITGITPATNGVIVTWDGPPGYYQLFQASSRQNPVWRPVGKDTNLLRFAIVTNHSPGPFFQVSGPSPIYAGAATCAECHSPILNVELHTRHAAAFTNAHFASDGGQTNGSCLACHTVGFDLPTGFISKAKTPKLDSVQCENCHGPAANHAANPDDPSVRPRAEVAATVCGGCHADPRHPTFSEWTNSAHALVTNLLVTSFNAANQMVVSNLNLDAPNIITNCGRCHSGSVRLSLLTTNTLPLPTNDADIAIVCAVCHDPHQTNANPAQLRNPVASTNDYFMPAKGPFLSQYNPMINVCAQCHNHAGASWTNTACEPHHSLQYNMLLGTIGELDSGLPPNQPAAHALRITNQCVGCHMQRTPFVSDTQPANTGHSFTVDTYALCLNCHSLPEPLVAFVTNDVSGQIQDVKSLLDTWAASKAPPSLARYGPLAWEYTTPGSLSSGGPGPDATEQLLIPANIQKARFNLYVVQNDGSLGVHNGPYAITLLDTAEEWIDEELNP